MKCSMTGQAKGDVLMQVACMDRFDCIYDMLNTYYNCIREEYCSIQTAGSILIRC
jgi:hypothetical protein